MSTRVMISGLPPNAASERFSFFFFWTWPWATWCTEHRCGMMWKAKQGMVGAWYPLHWRGPRRQFAIWEVTPPVFALLAGGTWWNFCGHKRKTLMLSQCNYRCQLFWILKKTYTFYMHHHRLLIIFIECNKILHFYIFLSPLIWP